LDLAVALGMLPEGHPAIDACNKLKRSIIRMIMIVKSHSGR
jgi:hypothetical protein